MIKLSKLNYHVLLGKMEKTHRIIIFQKKILKIHLIFKFKNKIKIYKNKKIKQNKNVTK